MSRVFITGVSGYIGGDVLYGLSKSNLASNIVALVRNESRAACVTEKYPSVTQLIGDLDSAAAIQNEVSQADVVLNLASSNHVPSAKAIAQGLLKTQKECPVWIQISGASVISGPEIVNNTYGEARPKIYNDLKGVGEVRDIIASNPLRVVDQLVTGLSASQPSVRTAVIYGPIIYGLGRGPVNQRSVQIPDLVKSTLQYGHGIHVGKGESTWSHVHVSDISRLIIMLVAEALSTSSRALWNENGIYFPEAGKLSFGEIGRKISSFAHTQGFIKSPHAESIDPRTADRLTAHGAVLWGTNAQTSGHRARKLLGWNPKGPSLEEEIPRATLVEAAAKNNPSPKLA
ncbi:hypothetical protein N7448_005695 [Penicillium atrosanguineum]|uniref:NAD-dependent epimerase/dehydratase domain-containing protein n=1 Tax=Penicillium atrosanguineum TaxID=1132637 RepID=A0A9W9PN05_9EURO|nr:uncharacterized protein N7443_009433 [Penicillium atrosanguineum]KAJ5126392.1 hypothetical protein N7526_008569 [Penicillium atrosanguineum]KAJ5137141.1 hypothetical protein N7448_005695 [Penicillium atrosanguineum]KAJ5293480.1 hypothetical protein N7443_009433 [Penicillium atrosanguineum]KAJ5302486.1 hypothetical protein N7476_009285 [Penicillium atrosanguineum]